MKKLCLVLALVLCMGCIAGTAMAETTMKLADVVGEWYAVKAFSGYESFLLLDAARMEMKRNGTAVFTAGDTTAEYTWKLSSDGLYVELEGERTIYMRQGQEEGTFEFNPNDGVIAVKTMDQPIELTYVFSKNEPELVKLGSEIAAEAEEDFFGEWKVIYAFNDRAKGALQLVGEQYDYTVKVEFVQAEFGRPGDETKTLLTDFVDGKLVSGESSMTLTDEGYLLINYVEENAYTDNTVYQLVAVKADAE